MKYRHNKTKAATITATKQKQYTQKKTHKTHNIKNKKI